MGLLSTFIQKIHGGGGAVDEADDSQSSMALAAAQAAIDEAIRNRQAHDRRAGEATDRRFSDAATYTGPDRRSGDRRRDGGFGRRTRD